MRGLARSNNAVQVNVILGIEQITYSKDMAEINLIGILVVTFFLLIGQT